MRRFKINKDGKFECITKDKIEPKANIEETVTQIDTWKPTLDSIRQAFGMKNRKQNGCYQYDETGKELEDYDGFTNKYEGKDINYINDAIKREKKKNDEKLNEIKYKRTSKKIKTEDEELTKKNKEELKELIKEAVKDSKKD